MDQDKNSQVKRWFENALRDSSFSHLVSDVRWDDQPDGGLVLRFKVHDNEKEFPVDPDTIDGILGSESVRARAFEALEGVGQAVRFGSPSGE